MTPQDPTERGRHYVILVSRAFQVLLFLLLPVGLILAKLFAPNVEYQVQQNPGFGVQKALFALELKHPEFLIPRWPYEPGSETSTQIKSWQQKAVLTWEDYVPFSDRRLTNKTTTTTSNHPNPSQPPIGIWPLYSNAPLNRLFVLGSLIGPARIKMGESHELRLRVWVTNREPVFTAAEIEPDRHYNASVSLAAPSFEFDYNTEQLLVPQRPAEWSFVLTPKEKHIGAQQVVANVHLRDVSDTNSALFARSSVPTCLRCSIKVTDPIALPNWAVFAVIPFVCSICYLVTERFLRAWRRQSKLTSPRAGSGGQSPRATPATLPVPACGTNAISHRSFLIALSFPGESRPFVTTVADHLAATFGKDQVFFDKYYEAELAQPDLDLLIGNIYEHQSKLVVPFFSSDYARKKWCNLEWRRMRQILFSLAAERIMPFRFDDAAIEGFLLTDGYIMVGSRAPEEVAKLILERLEKLPPAAPPSPTPPS